MRSFAPSELAPRELHRILLSCVAPRPIALVGTVDRNGNANLSPYSFFNAFSSNPPVVAFGPARRAKDGMLKDTYNNLMATQECTISVVTYSMVEQSNLSSCIYPPDIDEFDKAGFTKRLSVDVAPPSVAESPCSMECRLVQMIHLAPEAKVSGNLAICRVVRFHISDAIFSGTVIDPNKIDLVGRMGLSWYVRASGSALFEVPQPEVNGIGIDALPEHIRKSQILTGNDLAKLASVEKKPARNPDFVKFDSTMQAEDFMLELKSGNPYKALYALLSGAPPPPEKLQEKLHKIAQSFLAQGKIEEAWQTLLLPL
ncbi:MAG: flavin reductase family protein [Bacteroidota bacterium]|nr:flavin reductase family protein [Candidatus Kapabacteria bacterium]MDW8220179.1 flavin reductase family protein [Bacteroidota bacterium]